MIKHSDAMITPNKWTLLSILVFLFPILTFSQNRSLSTLPLVNNGDLVEATQDFNDSDDYKRLLKIYEDLVAAKGDFRRTTPKLSLNNQVGFVASMNYAKNEITMERQAYDAIKDMGDDALAFLLGHELIHYYENHAWKGSFAKKNNDIPLGKLLLKMQDQVLNETRSDYLGGFLAYTAGYGLFDKGDQVINALYDAYNLPDTLKGYPEKKDRIEMSKRTANQIQRLVDVFDMANMLFAIGRNKDAIEYYQSILNEYQSRELYNNVGTISLINAMELFDQDSLLYRYPVSLDINFRGSKDVSEVPIKEQIRILIDQAISHYNSAISLDPNYAPSYLNKAHAYALKKEWRKALFYLEEEAMPIANLKPIENAKILADAKNLLAIISAQKGEKDKAESLFDEAISMGSPAAIYNKNVLLNKSNPAPNTEEKNYKNVKVGFQSIRKFLNSPVFDDKKNISVNGNITLFQRPDKNKNAIHYFQHNAKTKRLFGFAIALEENKEKNSVNNIGNGDSKESLISACGQPTKILDTTQGEIFTYPGIVYILENNKVVKWATYHSKKSPF